MKQEVILEVNNLSKKIGKISIIKDISFQLRKGEIKGLLGPNGSGKTTILKLLVGLLKPTEGTIRIENHDRQSDFENAIRNVGAVIENPELYEYLTGFDNLQQFFRMAPGVSESRVAEVIELLAMNDFIYDKVQTYSLGMLQRLGLAQALLHNPAVLLLDEPTNGLDPSGVQDLRKHLKKLANDGVAIIISSHLLAEIEIICDSILIIDDGQIVSQGDIDEFKKDKYEDSIYFFRILEIDKLQNVLSEHRQFDQVIEFVSNGFSIRLSELDVAKLNKFLVENNFSIIGIEKVRTSLEDVFLAKVKR